MRGKKRAGKEAETGKQDERAARRRGRGGEPVSAVIGEFPRDHDLPVLPLETEGEEEEKEEASMSCCTPRRKRERKNEKE